MKKANNSPNIKVEYSTESTVDGWRDSLPEDQLPRYSAEYDELRYPPKVHPLFPCLYAHLLWVSSLVIDCIGIYLVMAYCNSVIVTRFIFLISIGYYLYWILSLLDLILIGSYPFESYPYLILFLLELIPIGSDPCWSVFRIPLILVTQADSVIRSTNTRSIRGQGVHTSIQITVTTSTEHIQGEWQVLMHRGMNIQLLVKYSSPH